jgi:hypothetical protein
MKWLSFFSQQRLFAEEKHGVENRTSKNASAKQERKKIMKGIKPCKFK